MVGRWMDGCYFHLLIATTLTMTIWCRPCHLLGSTLVDFCDDLHVPSAWAVGFLHERVLVFQTLTNNYPILWNKMLLPNVQCLRKCVFVVCFACSVVGPAVTFRIRPNSKNLTSADVAEKAGKVQPFNESYISISGCFLWKCINTPAKKLQRNSSLYS